MSPSFSQGFIRPGVYVKQTSGQAAPQLPSSFVAAFIGQGSDRFTVTNKEIVASGGSTDVLDSDRNVATLVSLTDSANLSALTSATVENLNVPFGSAALKWSVQPAAGKKFYATYIAYKNPAIDFTPVLYNDNMSGFLADYGQPVASTAQVINGVYVKNAISMGAYIASSQGAKSWYGCQLNPYNESTVTGATLTAGTIVNAVGVTGATGVTVQLNGDGAQTVTVTAGLTGDARAAEVQAGVRALSAANPALQAAYDKFTCTSSIAGAFTLTSGMVGSGTIAVSGGITGGVVTAGQGPTMLNLASEAGLVSSLTQCLAKLELVDSWAVIPVFPAISGGTNASALSVIESHVTNMRQVSTQKWRVALVGAAKNTDTGTNPETKYINTQSALGTDALGVVAPSTAKFIYGGVDYTLDGWAIAAAVAGIMTNPIFGAGEPVAGKDLAGFSSIKDVFNTTQKNLMGTAGVLMIDSELGTPAIIMDLTTDQSNAVNSQFKFTRAKDYVSKSLRQILRKLYINTNNLGDTTMSNIGSSVKMILQQMAWLHIIADFSDISVAKNPTDPRQVDVVVAIQLVPDVSWIFISLGVNL